MDVCQWSQIFFCCIGKLIHFRFCTESKVLAYLLVAMQTRDSLTETTFFGSSRQLIFLLRMKLAELIRTMHCHSPELLRLQWNWVSEHFLRKWSWTRRYNYQTVLCAIRRLCLASQAFKYISAFWGALRQTSETSLFKTFTGENLIQLSKFWARID